MSAVRSYSDVSPASRCLLFLALLGVLAPAVFRFRGHLHFLLPYQLRLLFTYEIPQFTYFVPWFTYAMPYPIHETL